MERSATDIIPPKATTSPVDRLQFLRQRSNKTQAQFAELINIDPSTLSKVLSGKQPLTEAFINRVVVNLGVSKQWLLEGQGVPYAKENPVPRVVADHIEERPSKGAPVYDIDVTAGCIPLDSQFTTENLIGYIDIPLLNTANPVVKVSGDSMHPRIPNGSFISNRPIQDASILHWGAPYVVELEDYRLVKVIKPCKSDPSKIVLHSENPEYDDIEVEKSAVLRFFLVEAIVNYQSLV